MILSDKNNFKNLNMINIENFLEKYIKLDEKVIIACSS